MHNLFIGSDDKKVSPKRAIDISCWTIKERTLKMLCNFLQDDLVANKSDRFYRAIPRGVLWMPTPSAAVSVGCCCQSWGEKRHRMQSTASVHPGTELLPFWLASLITWGFSLGATSGHHWVNFDFTPLKAWTWPQEGTCQTSWHVFFITGELGDSDQLSSLSCMPSEGADLWGPYRAQFPDLWVPDRRASLSSLWCRKPQQARKHWQGSGPGSITWRQKSWLLPGLGSLCPHRGQVSETAIMAIQRPTLGKGALGRAESFWFISLAHYAFPCAVFILRKAYFYDCLHTVWIFIISRNHCFESEL